MKYKKWTSIETKTLLKLKNRKLTYLEISEIMGRSPDSLRRKFWVESNKLKVLHEDAKVLVYDIETSLMNFKAFSTGKQYLGPNNIEDDWFILSYAAKWLNEDKVYSKIVSPREAKRRDDKKVCKSLFKLMDEADVIIGHNSIAFDNKKANTRFLYHGLGLPRPYKNIDTLKLIRKICKLSSNKLDYALNFFNLGGKLEHYGMQMWKDCENGDRKALDLMLKYNIIDVTELEKLYVLLSTGLTQVRPFRYGWKDD